MINRCCVVVLHMLMLNEVCLQEPIVGFIGGSADLPCSSKKHQLKLQDITVRWRYNDSLNVYDIIHGSDSLEEQHSAYRNRVKTFPAEYEKGNFSLRLTNLRHNDTGKYVCYHSDIQSVELLVKEKEKSIQVEENDKRIEEKENQGAHSRAEKMTPVAVLSVFILLSI